MSQSYSNRRREPRNHNFQGKIFCTLLNQDKTQSYSVEAVDVSIRGFGFFSPVPLVTGQYFWLDLAGKSHYVEVVYSESHLGLTNKYRIGVFAREEGANLFKRCVELGWLIPEGEH